ncbi:sulfatase [Bacteroidota bacterium]
MKKYSGIILVYGILSLVLCISVSCMNPKKTDRPNILIILIDDQDMDEISTYGGDVYTPNMDRLAEEGIKFNQAYVSSTVCTPSRYSFLTGRYAGNSYSNLYENQVGADGQGFPGFNVALENDGMNVAHELSQAGYVTGFTGKYHLVSKPDQPEMYEGEDAFIEGFKEGMTRQTEPTPEISKIFAHNEAWSRKYLKHIGFDWAKNIYEGNLSLPFSAHNPEWTTKAVFEFLEENQDKAFFLQCCPTLLHGPDGEWVRSFNFPDYTSAGEIKAPPSVMVKRKELRDKLFELGYDPESGDWGIAWIDAMIGEIMGKLEELGIADNTLLIFAPDHGSTDKACLFGIDGSQIPLIMRWPEGIPAGIESDALVQNIDLAPTYFELAEASIPDNYQVDGQSLVPLLKNGSADEWRDHLYFELGNARAVMTGDWKYITLRYSQEQIQKIKSAKYENLPKLMAPLQRLGIGTRGADHPGFWDEDQLYNLLEDPQEMNNLAYDPEFSVELMKMKELLTKDIEKLGRPYGEFLYNGNAALNGQVDKEIKIVKQIKIRGKDLTIPEHFKRQP